ncbi:MAG: hypothetical protein Q7U82_12440 [Gammaproteobacteria bacterium]|nr:hypothetical protein [Gammaproteobacteria bacterium]
MKRASSMPTSIVALLVILAVPVFLIFSVAIAITGFGIVIGGGLFGGAWGVVAGIVTVCFLVLWAAIAVSKK